MTCPADSFCNNTPGSYTCQCKAGFEGDLCTDINECGLKNSCHANASCTNNFGSYECACKADYHGNGKVCKIGQCDDRGCTSNGRCISPTSDECECKEGFRNKKGTNFCEDIDECLLANDCHENSKCVNSEGSFTCSCNSGYFGDGEKCIEGSCEDDMCPLNEECVASTTRDCECKIGFSRNATDSCLDTDECATIDEVCDTNANCTNTPGSYNCNCIENYFGDGKTCFQGSCSDANCPLSDNKKCVLPTTVDCECVEGFEFDQASVCVDSDECKEEPCNNISSFACINTQGSFYCSCKSGFLPAGSLCSDLDECMTSEHKCNEQEACTNTMGNYTCPCKNGYISEQNVCSNFDECAIGLHNCHPNATCYDTEGSFGCYCKSGFVGNDTSCVDVDECSNGFHDCSPDASCENSIGSFICSCENGVGEICKLSWVLVLNTGPNNENQKIIDGKGESKLIGFDFDTDTEVRGSCSILWQGKFYIFGGLLHKKQISVIQKCKLKRVGNLQFDMKRGACTQRDNSEVFICFNNPDFPPGWKVCYRANGPTKAGYQILIK